MKGFYGRVYESFRKGGVFFTGSINFPPHVFFVGDFLVKLCFRCSFKQILKLFWVGKKVLRFT